MSLSSFFTHYNKGEIYDQLFSHYNVNASMITMNSPMVCLAESDLNYRLNFMHKLLT